MTDEILDAVMKECQAIPYFQVGTVMLKTDFDLKKIGSYDAPFLLFDFMEAADSGQLIGGLTRMDWVIGMNSYNREPDAMGDDETGYSTGLMKVVDVPRRHFSKGNNGAFILPADMLIVGKKYMVLGGADTDTVIYDSITYNVGDNFTAVIGQTSYTTPGTGYLVTGGWLTVGMWNILNKYGLRFTLSGITTADALEGDGLVMGYRVGFDSISFDQDTSNIAQSSVPLTALTNVGNPPY